MDPFAKGIFPELNDLPCRKIVVRSSEAIVYLHKVQAGTDDVAHLHQRLESVLAVSCKVGLTIAKRIVQSSHHTFFVIHSLTDQRNATTISVTVITTLIAMTIAGPLFTSPSGGEPVELILRDKAADSGC